MEYSISVITLVKGRETQLKNLIKGLEQSTIFPCELIIVNMNQAAYQYTGRSLFSIKNIHVKNIHQPIPLAQARNAGANAAKGDLLLFLDVDCIPSPTLIERMLEAQLSESGLIMGNIRYLKEGWETEEFSIDHLYSNSIDHPRRPKLNNQNRIELKDHGYFWSLCFSILNNDFKRLQGFDENFVNYGAEDTDFGLRALKNDIKFFIIDADCFHQYHPVCRPPLNNFSSIVKNAQYYKLKWGTWVMEKWLADFRKEGYINWQSDKDFVEVVKVPSKSDIASAIQSSDDGF